MMTDTLCESDTERPYRITDFHGEVVADELDDVPPLLTQQEIAELSKHLEEQELSSAALVGVLAKLPDFEYGRGELPDGFSAICADCGEEIAENELADIAFGHYYHQECVP